MAREQLGTRRQTRASALERLPATAACPGRGSPTLGSGPLPAPARATHERTRDGGVTRPDEPPMTRSALHPASLPPCGSENTLGSRHAFAPAPPDSLPAPLLYDVRERALRQREMNFAAKRLADMAFVTGFGWEDALARLRWRGVPPTGGIAAMPDGAARKARLVAAAMAGEIAFAPDLAARRLRVTWHDPSFGEPVIGGAAAPRGWGSIVTGTAEADAVTTSPVPRARPSGGLWPLGTDVPAPPAASPSMLRAAERFFAASPGAYGLLVAAPDRILFERHGNGAGPGTPTSGWSMNKCMTATLIGRLLHLGWLEDVHAPAPAPAWRDPRGIHRLITLDHLLRMRSGLAMVCVGDDGAFIGFEGSAVYFDAGDSFAAAQANIVAARPGAAFRYGNAGINVLGAIIRDRIERRGLPYHETNHALLADRLGMADYQQSGDLAGNLIGSGAALATPRDWARLGVLYLQDGVWNGERLLPEGWVDYALAVTEGGSSYAATFWTNADRLFPALPPDAAWLSGASDQRVFILRGANRVVAVTNETEAPMDLRALNDVLAVVIGEA